ncbi:MAG: methyl-accepting chemotaxis protein [Pseudomonadota bacterium]
MIQIDKIRLKGLQVTVGVIVASALVLLGISAFLGGLIYGLSGLALCVVPCGLVLAQRYDALARITTAATLPVYAALFLAVSRETIWLLDMHMLFFAYLAVVAIMADWRAILAATAVTALHHLVLNFAAPAFVFPDGASLGRVLLHAGIVVMETGVLVILCLRIESLVIGLAQARQDQSQQEERAAAEREATNQEQCQALETLKARLGDLSQGNLTTTVHSLPETYREFEDNFNISVGALDTAIGEVINGIQAMNAGTMEIRSASSDLSRRTEEQAASLEETAAAISQTSERVNETARAAQSARATVATTNTDAQDGAMILADAVSAMGRIEKSSEEITNIIAVIDSIAFQTNLLALNAGVEAARAGETGKGFAVVASEVRALAQRCSEAAEDVKSLITASGEHVSTGAELVKRSGGSFSAITKGVSDLTQSLDAIAASSEAQADTLTQISDTVHLLDRSTQQNAAMAEECTATATSLASEADGLARSVSRFRTSAPPSAGDGTAAFNPIYPTTLAA